MSNAPDTSKIIHTREIIKMLPHRPPFLLVDKILDYDIENGSIVGLKNVTMNEPFFQGHFPDAPIMPGVLIVEALAQTGGILIHLKGETKKIAVLLSISSAKFRNPVHPGDTLTLKCENLFLSSKAGKVQATAYVNDKIAVQGEVSFALVDKSQI